MSVSVEIPVFKKAATTEGSGPQNGGAPAAPASTQESMTAHAAEPTARELVLQSKIDELLGTISEMQSRSAAQEAETQRVAGDQRVKEAKASAAGNGEKLGIGRQDFLLAKAVSQVGGPALYNRLSVNEKLRLMDAAPTTPAEQQLAAEHFGPRSDSLQSALLRRSDPAQYLRLRLIYKVSVR